MLCICRSVIGRFRMEISCQTKLNAQRTMCKCVVTSLLMNNYGSFTDSLYRYYSIDCIRCAWKFDLSVLQFVYISLTCHMRQGPGNGGAYCDLCHIIRTNSKNEFFCSLLSNRNYIYYGHGRWPLVDSICEFAERQQRNSIVQYWFGNAGAIPAYRNSFEKCYASSSLSHCLASVSHLHWNRFISFVWRNEWRRNSEKLNERLCSISGDVCYV